MPISRHESMDPEAVARASATFEAEPDTPIAQSLLIVEGQDATSGQRALAIVLTATHEDGTPYAVAYPVNADEMDELAAAFTAAAEVLRAKEAVREEPPQVSESEIAAAQVETDE